MQMSMPKIASRYEGKLFVSAAISEYFEDQKLDIKEAMEDAAYEGYDAEEEWYASLYDDYEETHYDDSYPYSYDDDPYGYDFGSCDDYYFADNYYAEKRLKEEPETKPEGVSLGDILASIVQSRIDA